MTNINADDLAALRDRLRAHRRDLVCRLSEDDVLDAG
jgi:hypothetical protein